MKVHPWLRAAALAVVANVLVVLYLQGIRQIPGIRNATVTLGLVLLIQLVAVRFGRLPSITAGCSAALGFNYYFQPPYGSFAIDDPQGWVAVIALLVAAIFVSQLSLHAKLQAERALARQRETERLYQLAQSLMDAGSSETVAAAIAARVVPIFGAIGAAFFVCSTDETHRAGDAASIPADKLRECAAGRSYHWDNGMHIVPVDCDGVAFGSLGVVGSELSQAGRGSLSLLVGSVVHRLSISDNLARQNRISESLLLNILPSEVANELRMNGAVSPKYFEDVTIVFTDFVGFTLSTESLAAEDVVVVLHDYFTAFDQVCTKYGLEKLKTIGDAYMCIAGLPMPVRSPSHPVDAVMAAFEMIHEVRRRDHADAMVHWKVRVGIHTGPVVAGVVGINKFAFDIWGDTVNYSARMESSGAPNRINISDRTHSRVKDFFECEHRGKVLTKDKREVDMYFVNGVLPKLTGPSDGAAPAAFGRRYQIYFQKQPKAFPGFLMPRQEQPA